jgi:hypothetical protein
MLQTYRLIEKILPEELFRTCVEKDYFMGLVRTPKNEFSVLINPNKKTTFDEDEYTLELVSSLISFKLFQRWYEC